MLLAWQQMQASLQRCKTMEMQTAQRSVKHEAAAKTLNNWYTGKDQMNKLKLTEGSQMKLEVVFFLNTLLQSKCSQYMFYVL